jgi:Tol biopolymer transport system component
VLSDQAQDADWARDGKLAIVKAGDSYYSIEYPPGNTVYRSTGRLNDLRISPKGDWIAFAEHPVPLDDGGQIIVVDTSSKESRVISSGWESIEGLAWHPSGREVWFTAATSGIERSLMAATLDGHVRTVAQVPGGMELQDVSASGKVLIDRSTERMVMMLGSLDEDGQKDISWLDWSRAVGISADGRCVLFDESGGGGGAAYSVFIAEHGSATPRRIGTGRAMDLSPDGRWALAQDSGDATKLTLISTDGLRHEPVQSGGIAYRWAKFIPGRLEMVFAGSYANQPLRLYKQLLPNGPVTLILSDGSVDTPVLSPDGRLAVAADEKGMVEIDLLQGKERKIPLSKHGYPVIFSGSDEVVLSSVQDRTITLNRLILSTGRITPYKRIEMTEAPGITETLPIYISRNLQTFVYSRVQSLSNLFVVSGWK